MAAQHTTRVGLKHVLTSWCSQCCESLSSNALRVQIGVGFDFTSKDDLAGCDQGLTGHLGFGIKGNESGRPGHLKFGLQFCRDVLLKRTRK